MYTTAVVYTRPVSQDAGPDFDVLWSGPSQDPRAEVERCARDLVLKHSGSIRAAVAFEKLGAEQQGWQLGWVAGSDTVEVTEQVISTAPSFFSWNVTHELIPRGHVLAVNLAPPVPPRTHRDTARTYAQAASKQAQPVSPPAKASTVLGPNLSVLLLSELRDKLLERARDKAEAPPAQ